MNTAVVKEYVARLDAKSRIMIRGGRSECYVVKVFSDGRIFLEPCMLVPSEALSKRGVELLDRSAARFAQGKVSEPIDLDRYPSR